MRSPDTTSALAGLEGGKQTSTVWATCRVLGVPLLAVTCRLTWASSGQNPLGKPKPGPRGLECWLSARVARFPSPENTPLLGVCFSSGSHETPWLRKEGVGHLPGWPTKVAILAVHKK